MKYSIIIPVYNVEDYISRCLDSIIEQGVDKSTYEIIVVDDGSPDNSSRIVMEYQKRYDNISLIVKKNGGVSSARNVGISNASGEYLVFLDPDDTLFPRFFTQFDTCSSNNADLFICKSYEKNKELYSWNVQFNEVTNYDTITIINNKYLRGSVCGIVFSRDFIQKNNIRFIEGIRNGEDTNFVLQSLFFAQNTVFLDIPMYNVVGRTDSASRTYSKERLDVMIQGLEKINKLVDELKLKQGNHVCIPLMLYSPISNLVSDTIQTKNAGYLYLKHNKVKKYCRIDNMYNCKFQKRKIQLLKMSFSIFYFLIFITSKIR